MILVMHPFGSSGVQNTSGMSFVLLFLLLLIGLSDPWTGLTSLSHELGSRLLKLDPLLSLGPLYGMPFPSLCVRLSFLSHCLHLSLFLKSISSLGVLTLGALL